MRPEKHRINTNFSKAWTIWFLRGAGIYLKQIFWPWFLAKKISGQHLLWQKSSPHFAHSKETNFPNKLSCVMGKISDPHAIPLPPENQMFRAFKKCTRNLFYYKVIEMHVHVSFDLFKYRSIPIIFSLDRSRISVCITVSAYRLLWHNSLTVYCLLLDKLALYN